MKVSVIIPVFNSRQHLAGTICSALKQDYPELEIIVVDDGSTDGSWDEARKFEGPQVKILRQKNAGAAVARNTGLSHASGAYIQFLDAGDLLSEEKISRQVEALEWQKNKVAVCCYRQFENDKDLKQPHYPDQSGFIYSSDQPLDFLVNLWGANGKANFIQTNCWLVPKALIERVGGWRPYRCPDDDGEFFARVVLASEGIVHVPGVYNYYRMADGANQLSSNRHPKYLMNQLLTIDLKHLYLTQKAGQRDINAAIAKQYLDFAVYHYPAHRVLSAVAMRRYRSLGVAAKTPLLGGRFIEAVKQFFGWRMARILRYYLRERTLV